MNKTKLQGAEYHLRVLVRKIKAPYYNEKEAMALILDWHNEQCYKCNKQLTEGPHCKMPLDTSKEKE